MTRQRRFRRLELAVAAVLVSILLVAFFERVSFYAARAEERAVEIVIAQLRAAVELERLRSSSEMGLAGSNPMTLLATKPGNYVGEFESLSVANVPKGSWFFVKQTKLLIYLLRESENFPNSQETMLYFKLELRRLPEQSARPAGTPHSNQGVVLNQILDPASSPGTN